MTTEQMDWLDDNRRKCCNSFKDSEHDLTCDNHPSNMESPLNVKERKPKKNRVRVPQRLSKAQRIMRAEMEAKASPESTLSAEGVLQQQAGQAVIEIIRGSHLRLSVPEWDEVTELLSQAIQQGIRLGKETPR